MDSITEAALREEIAGLHGALKLEAETNIKLGATLQAVVADRDAIQAALDEASGLLKGAAVYLVTDGDFIGGLAEQRLTAAGAQKWLARRDAFLSRQTNPNPTETK